MSQSEYILELRKLAHRRFNGELGFVSFVAEMRRLNQKFDRNHYTDSDLKLDIVQFLARRHV